MTEKIEEDINIYANEGTENKIKDIDISLNTSDDNFASDQTELINGELLACILRVENVSRIIIRFAELPKVILLDLQGFSGIKYIPLKVDSLNSNGERLNFNSELWKLNNRIEVIVESSKNTIADVTLRYR